MLNRKQRKQIQKKLNKTNKDLDFNERSELIRKNLIAGKQIQETALLLNKKMF